MTNSICDQSMVGCGASTESALEVLGCHACYAIWPAIWLLFAKMAGFCHAPTSVLKAGFTTCGQLNCTFVLVRNEDGKTRCVPCIITASAELFVLALKATSRRCDDSGILQGVTLQSRANLTSQW